MTKTSKGFDNRIKLIMAVVLVVVLIAVVYLAGRSLERTSKAQEQEKVLIEIREHELESLSPTWFDKSTDLGTGAKACDFAGTEGIFIIDGPGDYVLSGEYDGQILIDAVDSNVHLFMDGVHIKSLNGPAIKCVNANKLVITLVDGSDNSVSDGADYLADEEDAAIYSETSITFNGTGKLGVDGLYKDAIHSKDIVKIAGGIISTKSVRYGIYAKDGIAITDGNVSISSKNDGIRTSGLGEAGKGSVLIENGEVSVISGKYGITAEKGNLYVTGGNTYINSVAGIYSVAGDTFISEGCINE